MKSVFFAICIVISISCLAQSEATTTLSTILLDSEISLSQKNKRTHSNFVNLTFPEDFWNQFERIDAVFISGWTGSGSAGKAQFEKNIKKIDPNFDASPLLYFAEKAPGFFTYPQQQTGFGTELIIMEGIADSSCLKRYKKAKIAPRGIYPCKIERFVTTTAVNFFYRYPLPKKYYAIGKSPKLSLLLRTSSKKDTVLLDTKIALTVMGKRYNCSPEDDTKIERDFLINNFLKDAVLNGLKKEGFPLNHARWVAENPKVFFVTKCQICSPVQAAFESYINNYQETKSTVNQKLLDALVLGKVEEKQIALSKIVNNYVEKHIDFLNLNAKEKSALLSKLDTARKKGMQLKSDDFGKFCPSCDGACGIKK